MTDYTKSCPICGLFPEGGLVNRTCPNKPTDKTQKWECSNPPHVTGYYYVKKWNEGIELAQAETIGIGAISDE